MDENDQKGYAWQREYERTWDSLGQDQEGNLIIPHRPKKKRLNELSEKIHRGIIRHVVIVIDASLSMLEMDYKLPLGGGNRLEFIKRYISTEWIEAFFDRNPLASVMVLGMRDGLAERWCDWTTTPSDLSSALSPSSPISKIPFGDASLQNALDLASLSLCSLPMHVSKEVFILLGSLGTCDPGDLLATVDNIKQGGIRISIVGIDAQVKVCETIAELTGGTYSVAIDQNHFKECLSNLIHPLASIQPSCAFAEMAFPGTQTLKKPTMCACHGNLISKGFYCPQCRAFVCTIPRECPGCTITLCGSTSLARSWHYLFPPAGFKDLWPEEPDMVIDETCFGCSLKIPNTDTLVCVGCKMNFCGECVSFIEDILHACPGCCQISDPP